MAMWLLRATIVILYNVYVFTKRFGVFANILSIERERECDGTSGATCCAVLCGPDCSP